MKQFTPAVQVITLNDYLDDYFKPVKNNQNWHIFGFGVALYGRKIDIDLTDPAPLVSRTPVCASAHPCAAERRLTVTGPGGWWRLGRTVPCFLLRFRAELRGGFT